MAASLRMDPRAFTIAPSANTETSARVRGPQYWDMRAGVRPREEIDLNAHLVEARPPGSDARVEVATQSDAQRPRARSPTFAERRGKTGVDASSQVPHGLRDARRDARSSGALFDFDAEVAPRVELLTRDVLAQALEELSHEGDLRALASRRKVVESSLAADAEVARASAAAVRAAGVSRAATVNAARIGYARQLSALERVSAVAMSGGAVRGALAAAFARALADGGLVDGARATILRDVLPRVYADVGADTAAVSAGGAVTDLLDRALVDALCKPASVASRRAGKTPSARRFAIRVYVRLPRSAAAVASEAAAGIPSTVDGEDDVEVVDDVSADGSAFRTVVVGPLRVTRSDTVGDIEARIAEWLTSTRSRHTRRVLVLAGTHPLGLYMHGDRLPRDVPLLSFPLEELAALELRPMENETGGSASWRNDIEEENVHPTSEPLADQGGLFTGLDDSEGGGEDS